MRLFLIVIYLGFIVSAKRRPKNIPPGNAGRVLIIDESDERMPFSDGVLNLRGSLRREFALEAALVDHNRNMICSPLSVLIPLGKLAMGAQRRTEKELLKALGLSSNKQVAQKTRNKITKLISSRDITEETSVVLVNAIYFAGKWLNKFEKTFTDDFFSPSGRHRIPMMSRTGRYSYWKSDSLNAQIIEIPYEGEQSSMIIVLPYSNNGLGVLLRALKVAPELLNKALEKMKPTDVILTMPKFKIESEINLNSLYKKIGVRTMFDSRHSELNKIIDDETVYVSKAIHKAIIEVNEKGTEASAATGIIINLLSAAYGYEVKVNHPFLFYIKVYQEQLFAGVFNGNNR